MSFVFHIRKPLSKKRGNQWYRDHGPRDSVTFCGAVCTAYDIPERSRADAWTGPEGLEFVPCEKCLEKRVRV